MKTIGYYIVIAGIACSVYFFMFFDATVYVSGSPILGIPDGRVNNVGLMQDKQNGLIIGIGAVIVGVILMTRKSRDA